MSHSSTTTTKATEDPDIIGSIDIKPGQESRFIVGIYEREFPQPELQVDADPDSNIQSSLKRQPDGAEYKLIYYIRNLKNAPCRVTVRTA